MNATAMVRRESLQPQTFEQLMKYAELVAKSGLVPRDYQNKPHDCLIAMQWASELGMNPLQGLQNIAVINGRPCIWGDMLPALVKNHPSYEWMSEKIEFDEQGKILAAVCTGQRKGHPEVEVRRFSITDAAKANLWGKSGPWTQYPQRMLQMRARSWLCRDLWPDALRGLYVAEEAQDMEIVQTADTPMLPAGDVVKTGALEGMWESLTDDQREKLRKMKAILYEYAEAGDPKGMVEYLARNPLDAEEHAGLFSQLRANVKTAIAVAQDTLAQLQRDGSVVPQ